MADGNGFQIQAGALRAAINLAARVAVRKGKIPVLRHLHLSAEDGLLTVSATDLEKTISPVARGVGDLPATTASKARLAALLAKVPAEDTVTLRVLPTAQLQIKATVFTASVFTLPTEDWPHEPLKPKAGDDTVSLTISAGALFRLLDRPSFVISTEPTRYYLNGILLHRRDAELRAVATDGHRLFLATEPYPAEAETIPDTIVPRSAVMLLRPLLARVEPEQAITLRIARTCMTVIARGWTVQAKCIDGVFPEYGRIIPQPTGILVTIQAARRLGDLIETAAAISSDRRPAVVLGNGNGSTLTMRVADESSDTCQVTVPGDVAAWATDEAHPEVGFNARYLRDACRVFPGGFTLRVNATEPALLTGPEGVSVIMPMRI